MAIPRVAEHRRDDAAAAEVEGAGEAARGVVEPIKQALGGVAQQVGDRRHRGGGAVAVEADGAAVEDAVVGFAHGQDVRRNRGIPTSTQLSRIDARGRKTLDPRHGRPPSSRPACRRRGARPGAAAALPDLRCDRRGARPVLCRLLRRDRLPRRALLRLLRRAVRSCRAARAGRALRDLPGDGAALRPRPRGVPLRCAQQADDHAAEIRRPHGPRGGAGAAHGAGGSGAAARRGPAGAGAAAPAAAVRAPLQPGGAAGAGGGADQRRAGGGRCAAPSARDRGAA